MECAGVVKNEALDPIHARLLDAYAVLFTPYDVANPLQQFWFVSRRSAR
jgi:hypothetical protein